jgi:hypothetical protein
MAGSSIGGAAKPRSIRWSFTVKGYSNTVSLADEGGAPQSTIMDETCTAPTGWAASQQA